MSNLRKRSYNLIRSLTAIILAVVLCMPFYVMAAELTPESKTLVIDIAFTGSSRPEETFTVDVTPKDDEKLPSEGASQGVTLSEHTTTGKLTFTFDFDSTGTYSYLIKERSGDTQNVTYDPNEYTVTFEVYQYGDSLRSVMRVSKNGESATKPDGISFENSYTPESKVIGDPPVSIRKIISGDTPEVKDPFVFIMRPLDESYPLPNGETGDEVEVSVMGGGEVEIGNIEFTSAGVYEYEVTERDDRIPGYSYDEAGFKVVYVVAEGEDGTLTCERTILKNNYEPVSECVFTNEYDADKASSGDSSQSSPSSAKGTDGSSGKTSTEGVKTGDVSDLYLYLLLFAASAIVLVLALRRKPVRDE